MKILFTLQAQIESKSIKIQVKESLDIFTIAKSIAVEHHLGQQSEEQIMIVILQTLAGLLDSSDVQLKADICKLLTNTVKKQSNPSYFQDNHKNETQRNVEIEVKKQKRIGLYDRAVIDKEQKKQFTKAVKQIEAEDEVRQCTFQPHINYYPIERNNTHEILYNNARMVKEKQEKIRKHKKQHEVDGYTFRPVINEQSQKILKKRCNNNSIKRTSFPQQFSYHPSLSKGTQKLAERFPNFEKRLERYMRNKKDISFEKQNSMISKSDKTEKTQKLDKYKSLFDDQGKDQERRMKLYGMVTSTPHHEESLLIQNTKIIKNNKSEELFLRRRARIFEYIYNRVEYGDVVNEQSIENNTLPEQLYQILEPLLNQISQLQVSLDKQQFINSLQRLYGSLSTIDKQLLVNIETKKKWEQGHQNYKNKYKFRPTISEKSKDLAAQRQLRPLRTFQNQEIQDTLQYDEVSQYEFKPEESMDSRFVIEEQEEEEQEQDEDNFSEDEIQLL